MKSLKSLRHWCTTWFCLFILLQNIQAQEIRIEHNNIYQRSRSGLQRWLMVDSNYIRKPNKHFALALHGDVFRVRHDADAADSTGNYDARHITYSIPARYRIGFSASIYPLTFSYLVKANKLFNSSDSELKRYKLSILNNRMNFELGYLKDKKNVVDDQISAVFEELGSMDEIDLNQGHYIADMLEYKQIYGKLDFFLNSRKYAPSATSSFSAIQRKSAGSPIVGLSYNYQDINLSYVEFSDAEKMLTFFFQMIAIEEMTKEQLEEMKEALAETSALPYYSGSDMWSHDFCLDLGYGYNYVIPHSRWVCNATLIGRAGLKYTKMERDTHFSNDEISSVIQVLYGDNVKSKSDYSFALNPSLRIGIGYSHDKWFFGSNIVFDYYLDKHLDTFMFNARLSAGYRFNLGSLRIGKK